MAPFRPVRYMLLIHETGERPQPGTPAAQAVMDGHAAFTTECVERGVFIAADPLMAPQTATVVRAERGETLVTDGPFAETAEWLAGYYLLDCRDRDEAIELAARLPGCAQGATIEVRPVLEMPDSVHDRNRRGAADLRSYAS